MAPAPSKMLALSSSSKRSSLTPREAILLASGLVGGAVVASHIYFLLKKRGGAKASLCSFLRLLGLGGEGALKGGMDPATGRLIYPKTARGSVVEALHGVAVPDPYRWLEDPDAKAVQAWVAAQNETTDAYFGTLREEKEKFRERMNELVRVERGGREGGREGGWVLAWRQCSSVWACWADSLVDGSGLIERLIHDLIDRSIDRLIDTPQLLTFTSHLIHPPDHTTPVPLRQVLVHVAEGGALLLLQEGGPPEPERALHPGRYTHTHTHTHTLVLACSLACLLAYIHTYIHHPTPPYLP
jgi:hypothetical protein